MKVGLNLLHLWTERTLFCSKRIKGSVRFHGTKINNDILRHSRWIKPQGISSDLRIYNCVAERKVPFVLTNTQYISWYTCGPTVYDESHLGHASCFVKLDIIHRIMTDHFNQNIVTAMNITDIDDKIIQKSRETGRSWQEIARHYESLFWRDMHRLNVQKPNIKIRVTEHIPEIVKYIQRLVDQKQAYVAPDGSVYFDVNNFSDYGKMQTLSEGLSGNESLETRIEKKSPMDFALWKACKSDHEPSWPSPWGPGRPGWHIECSALAEMIFGKNVHIHAGGIDLRFPHHENEEAQSCCYHDIKQWVNYWLHTGLLSVKDQKDKMSKSLKNTIGIDEMLQKYTADDFRMACVLSNYRNAMEYSDELMELGKNTLNRFRTFQMDCEAYLTGKRYAVGLDESVVFQNLQFARSHIDGYLRDDFDTSKSIRILMDQISSISRCINTPLIEGIPIQTTACLDAVAAVSNYVQFILNSFGFTPFDSQVKGKSQQFERENDFDFSNLLNEIVDIRDSLRKEAAATKNQNLFKISDNLRNSLQKHGITIRDSDQGSLWNFSKG